MPESQRRAERHGGRQITFLCAKNRAGRNASFAAFGAQ
jgi:hypothetical protein